MLRSLEDVKYLAILSVRPAELRALEELPGQDKDALLPYVLIRPWATAETLDSALTRIEKSYGKRPWIADVTEVANPDGDFRTVHFELQDLRDPSSGYANWCSFIARHTHLIPAVQLADISQLELQVRTLAALRRGIVVRVTPLMFDSISSISGALSALIDPSEVLFVIDYEQRGRDLLGLAAATVGRIETISRDLDGCHVAIAASSFPEQFVNLSQQEIFERGLFSLVGASGPRLPIIYADRGSARAERSTGGSGLPAPRVDYPTDVEWKFFRRDGSADRNKDYQRAARDAMASPAWDKDLRIWGVQMIERTAVGDTSAITSPQRATAVRINIHLHRQLFFGSPSGLHSTDEDWVD